MTPPAVLHVTSLLGGGVDRHVRDIARSIARRHLVWHAGEAAEVMEIPAERRFHPLDRERVEHESEPLARWLRSQGVGLVHVHSMQPAARSRAAWTMRSLGVGCIATLHDVLFLRRDAFGAAAPLEPERDWLAQTAGFLRAARAVVAPSEYVAALARRHIEGLDVQVIPNGSAPASSSARGGRARAQFAAHRPRDVVAVLGAIGPHKGSDMLDELAAALEGTGIALVVIGYLEKQLLPGWRAPGTLFVHGAYADAEVCALLDAYGAQVALFPNRLPEGFSYALSDLWSCALPVLAAPQGALAERISRHGGGWLLPEGFDAPAIAAKLRLLCAQSGSAERARVKSQLSQPDPDRVPTLESMARSLDALYARYGIDPAASPAEGGAAIEQLLAKNLDGSLFRLELARLADELQQALREGAARELRFREFEAEARDWIAKLERDIATLKSDIEREVAARRALGEENVQLRIHKDAFDLLPGMLRKLLLKKILNARS